MDKFKSQAANVRSGKKATQESKNKCRTTSGLETQSLFTSATSSSLASEDPTDSDYIYKTDVGSIHTSDSKKKTVDVRAEYGQNETPETSSKFIIKKHKYKVIIEKKSLFPSATSSSLASEDQSDSDWVCKTKIDVVPSNIPDSKNNVLHARARKGKKATRESKNKLSTTKKKHKSTRGKKSRFTSVPSSSLASADPSDSGWTCKTDPVLRNAHNSKKKIVDAKAGPAKVTRKRNYKLSPTKHKYKSVLKKRRVASVPGSKFAAVNPSGSGSKEKASALQVSPFIDLTYWKMTRVCCGIIFKGLNGEVMIDAKLFKPCKPGCKEKPPVKETPQSNQSLDDTYLNSSSSSTNAGETDFNSASNLSITDTMGPEIDA